MLALILLFLLSLKATGLNMTGLRAWHALSFVYTTSAAIHAAYYENVLGHYEVVPTNAILLPPYVSMLVYILANLYARLYKVTSERRRRWVFKATVRTILHAILLWWAEVWVEAAFDWVPKPPPAVTLTDLSYAAYFRLGMCVAMPLSVYSLQNLLGPATRADFELLHELPNAEIVEGEEEEEAEEDEGVDHGVEWDWEADDDDDDDDWDVWFLDIVEAIVDELIATPENLDRFERLLRAGPGRLV